MEQAELKGGQSYKLSNRLKLPAKGWRLKKREKEAVKNKKILV